MKKLFYKLRLHYHCCGYQKKSIGAFETVDVFKKHHKCLAIGKCRREILIEKLKEGK